MPTIKPIPHQPTESEVRYCNASKRTDEQRFSTWQRLTTPSRINLFASAIPNSLSPVRSVPLATTKLHAQLAWNEIPEAIRISLSVLVDLHSRDAERRMGSFPQQQVEL